MSLNLLELNFQNVNYLRNSQNEDGTWNSYWWNGPEYATCFAIEALKIQKLLPIQKQLDRTKNWLKNQIVSDQISAFNLSLFLRIALAIDLIDCADLLMNRLIREQNPDGSWPSSAELRIPPPWMVNPEENITWSYELLGGRSIRLDEKRLFTTATAILAIQKYIEYVQKK
nr:prenyltransferase/squalene oxidase repeat-containing protein [Salinimicrobium sediminilitoris]